MRNTLLCLLLLAAGPAAGDTDLRLPVRRGDRLAVRNQNGEVRVEAWSENAIFLRAEHAPGVEVRIVPRGRTHHVEAVPVDGDVLVRLRLLVPSWMPVRVEGVNSPVVARGLRRALAVETVNGDVLADRVRGQVVLASVNGEVRVRGARGRVRATSINRDVALEDVEGNVFGEAVNGDIVLRTVTGDSIVSSTVRGDVDFAGRFRPQGHYAFATHDGDVRVRLPRETGARVESYVFSGDLITGIPLPELERPSRDRRRAAGRRYVFQLGSGEARLELESFQGDIELDWLENSRIR